MKLNELDLNLLLVFEAILRTGSVTLASEEVGLTQPSLSNALTRLRQYFNDPLFVRTTGTMRPTPLASRLAQPVLEALNQLRVALEDKRHFDPASSVRDFSICMTEVAQRIFLPVLLKDFREAAPGVRITTVEMSKEQAENGLGSGEIDLVVGYFDNFGTNFYTQRIFQERYVVMVRKGHPAAEQSLSLETYSQAVHIDYLPSAASHQTLATTLEREFSQRGIKRKVGLTVAHSLGLASIVESTDLMLTIPSRLAQAFSDFAEVQLFELPLNIPQIDIKQYWHARYHLDPAAVWLRNQFQSKFQF